MGFRHADSRDVLLALYHRWRAELSVPNEVREVDTPSGRTHMLVAGPADAPPVLLPNGLNSHSAETLTWFGDLAADFRLYCLDIPGQPGPSENRTLSRQDDSYGRWLAEVADALGFERVHYAGMSQGGWVVTRLAAYAPQRIDRAALLVPSGFHLGNMGAAFGVLGKTLLQRMFPNHERPAAMARSLLAPQDRDVHLPPVMLEHFEAVMQHIDFEFEQWAMATPEALADYDRPTLIMPGRFDPLFDCDAVIEAAKASVKDLRIEVLESGHGPLGPEKARMVGLVREHLTG